MKKIFIKKEDSSQRIDKFLFKYFNVTPKSFIYKSLRKKNIKLNDRKTFGSEILKPNDYITLYFCDETIDKLHKPIAKIKSDKPLDILYEDNNILVCNKPAGLLSQPRCNSDTDTLLNRLYNIYGSDIRICNRLDRNTSGIIICGKNFLATQRINNLILNHLIEKFYLTIVKGQIKTSGCLSGYIEKDKKNNLVHMNKSCEGKKILTEYKPIKYANDFTLLELKLITGRSHQIRLHMQSIGHPVIGDTKYGDKKTNSFFYDKFRLCHQILHAHKIKFKSGELDGKEIICPVPRVFLDLTKFLFVAGN